MAETTVEAPSVEAPEGTTEETTEATSESKPLTDGERIKKAMGKDMPLLHTGFKEWIEQETNGDFTVDLPSVLATQSLYNLWRKTDRFAELKEQVTAEAGTRTTEATPKTPEEAQALLKKHQEASERRKKQQERADARMKEIEALMAAMASEDSEESDEADVEADEETSEAF